MQEHGQCRGHTQLKHAHLVGLAPSRHMVSCSSAARVFMSRVSLYKRVREQDEHCRALVDLVALVATPAWYQHPPFTTTNRPPGPMYHTLFNSLPVVREVRRITTACLLPTCASLPPIVL
ncbi:unnamed protein product [Periconia digitata]|uniref:Uncharacterized protein n=1 Tax=Periconia digitata TaxID=1303443 RepID=A0A9W4XTJ9_9PLEO|nr:unnamed protein product [Periconia digitata]